MKALSANTRRSGDAIVIALHGDLDFGSVDRAQAAVDDAERERPALLVLDLRGLNFLDSTGLRMVIKSAARAKNEGRRLSVVPGDRTQALVHTVQPDKLFEVADTPEAAIARVV